jgi:nucleoside-diphosphate-sugar epimerase
MTILVTGGAGLVGRAVCGGLAALGCRVRSVDLSSGATAGVDERVVDLRLPEAILPHLEGVEAIVHLANHSHQWRADPQTILAENAAINANVFQAAVEAGIRSVIFSSSVQVVSGMPLDDRASGAAAWPAYPLSGDSPPRPGNAYAASKVMGEELLRYYAVVHQVAAVALRLPYIATGRNGWERQAARMSQTNWPYEGFAWLWAADLAPLIACLLAAPMPGYRCLLPSAPPPADIPEVKAALDQFPNHRARMDELAGWRPTPYASSPDEVS